MRTPYWSFFVVAEMFLALCVIVAGLLFGGTGAEIASVLTFIGILIYTYFSLAIVMSPTKRKELLRPEAIVEPRHFFFLSLGGVIGLVLATGFVLRLLIVLFVAS